MRKKLLSMLLSLAMLLSLVPTFTVGAAAADALPAGFTAVEYIEHTAIDKDGGYIDTGYHTSNATTSVAYEIRHAFNSATRVNGNNESLLGASLNNGRSGLIVAQANNTAAVFGKDTVSSHPLGPLTAWANTTDTVTTNIDIDIAANTYTVKKNGTVLDADKAINGTPKSTATVYVFANHSGASAYNTPARAKVYSLKIWEDGALKRNFVPCKQDSTGYFGLYDLVGEKFYAAATPTALTGPGAEENPATDGEYSVTLTAPAAVTVEVSAGFADGGEKLIETSSTTTDGVTAHLYKLDAGNYRFLSYGTGYYKFDKQFVVTEEKADVPGGMVVNADPGKQLGTGWEQSSASKFPLIREYTDEFINSGFISVTPELKAKYPDAFAGPTFTKEGKHPYEYTTQPELEAFLADLEANCDNMYTYQLGCPDKTYGMDITAAVMTKTDLSGAATLEDAAALVRANGKLTIDLQAQVHGNEQTATEGALGILTSLAGAYGDEILDTVNVIVMPRLNTSGSKDYGYSPTDVNDLNRDYYALIEPQTQKLVHVYNIFQPEVVIDLHECRYSVFNGSDYDVVPDLKMAGLENLNIPAALRDLEYDFFFNSFAKTTAEGLRPTYYRDSTANTNPISGRGNYFTRGSVSILLEIPGQRSRMMGWERRVLSQYVGVKTILDYAVANAARVKATVAQAKADIVTAGTYYDPENNLITLQHVQGSKIGDIANPTFDFATGTYKSADATKAFYKYDKAALQRPRPLSYVVSKDALQISRVLKVAEMQNIAYEELPAGEAMALRQYSGDGTAADIGAQRMVSFPNGAYVFPMNQISGVVLSLLMEPDVLDCTQGAASFVQQGVLKASDIYRCESVVAHQLTFVPEVAASCTADGMREHYACTCGKLFMTDVHENEVAAEDITIHTQGHTFFAAESGYICTNCEEEANTIEAAVEACTAGGLVLVVGEDKAVSVDSLIVPSTVKIHLAGNTLTVENNLTVNKGGVLAGGTLKIKDGATVQLNDNTYVGESTVGYVPVWTKTEDGYKFYELNGIEMKTGKNIEYLEDGTKYAFGYKYADFAAYLLSVGANANTDLKFGANLTMRSGDDTLSGDYVYAATSIAKMAEVTDAADAFYRVNLKVGGANADSINIRPMVKMKSLGFRMLGALAEDDGPAREIAEVGGVRYTDLAAAVAAAEALGGNQEISLIDNITFKRPATINVNGHVRFVVSDGEDITISGPVTFDGQNQNAQCLLFRVTGTDSKLTLKNGVTIQNYRNTKTGSDNNSYGGVIRVDTSSDLALDHVTIRNCSGQVRGAVYISTTKTVNITNCTFENNTAVTAYGGAIAIYKAPAVNIENCTFTGNSAQTYGGAVRCSEDCELLLKNCTFTGNSISDNSSGAAVYVGARTKTVIDSCTMSNNTGKIPATTYHFYGYTNSQLTIKGDCSLERVALDVSGYPIKVDGTVTGSVSVYISDANCATFVSSGKIVLVGDALADCCDVFTVVNGTYVFTADGRLEAK